VVATAVVAISMAPPLHTEVPLGFQPAFGVVLGALLLLPRRRWGWVLAGAVVFESLVHGLLHHDGLFAADVSWRSTLALVVTPLVVACVLTRDGERESQLVPAGHLVWFLAVVLVAGLAVPMLTLAGSGFSVPVRFVAAHSMAMGMLVVTPVMLAWRRPVPVHRRAAEAVAVALAVLVACSVVFLSPASIREVTRPYWVVLPMAWAALRFGLRGGAWSVFATASISLWATAWGFGPFVAASGDTPGAVIYAQLFVAVVSIATLLIAAAVEDLRDRGELERRLRHQAYHDDLTGLPNRAYLSELLDDRLGPGGADRVSVLICDVDNFKVINDGLGQQVGDRLLVQLAARLRACIRPDDTLTRLSGDEFVVTAENCAPELVRDMAERILVATAEPFELEGTVQIRSSMSIGGTCAAAGTAAAEALRQAEAALHRAKKEGKARLCRFDDDLRAEVRERLLIEADFSPALAAGEVRWHLQPEIDLKTGAVFCLEALCRWHHPDLGAVPPDRFVPVVESAGGARELFVGALEVNLAAQQELCRRVGTPVPVGVNLSSALLGDERIVDHVERALEQAGTPAEHLWIEVTEGALAAHGAQRTLSRLHELGVRLAIDDFGTGWSSMSRLATLPWDALKIDRSLVAPLGAGHPDDPYEHLVAAVVAMAHSLHLKVVAEGVENLEQLALVRELGCDVVQGWLFSKAVEPRELVGLVDPDGRWVGPGLEVADAG
jgi:diguanylate cyclase (GGDEF)-like protein